MIRVEAVVLPILRSVGTSQESVQLGLRQRS
jgi:hypothetical protein